MFEKRIGDTVFEISHKFIERPNKSLYFNHIHDHCELLLFIRGDACYNIDGQIFKPSPYDLIFIPAATYHYLMLTSSSPYENYVIGLDVLMLSEKRYEKLFSPPLMINIRNDEHLCSFFSRLDSYESEFSESDFSESALSVIRELLIYCDYHKDGFRQVSGKSLDRIDEIVSYILENLDKPLDAEMIARHFLISQSYVQNIFSQNMHIGLKKYIMQKKIYAASADMKRGLSPKEACDKYCFGDYSSFYRLYKRIFSTSPREQKLGGATKSSSK